LKKKLLKKFFVKKVDRKIIGLDPWQTLKADRRPVS
jgi:hypothetical protein